MTLNAAGKADGTGRNGGRANWIRSTAPTPIDLVTVRIE